MLCRHSFPRRTHPKTAHYISIRQLHCLSLLHSDDSKQRLLLAWAQCLPVESPPDSTASLGVTLFWTHGRLLSECLILRGYGQTGASRRQIHIKPGLCLSCVHPKEDVHLEPRETFYKTCWRTTESTLSAKGVKSNNAIITEPPLKACLPLRPTLSFSDQHSSKTNPLSHWVLKGQWIPEESTARRQGHTTKVGRGGGFYNAYGDTSFRSFSQTAPQQCKMLRYT